MKVKVFDGENKTCCIVEMKQVKLNLYIWKQNRKTTWHNSNLEARSSEDEKITGETFLVRSDKRKPGETRKTERDRDEYNGINAQNLKHTGINIQS